MAAKSSGPHKTYIVEHLDPELGPWSTLEYLAISQESAQAQAAFCLSSVPKSLIIPSALRDTKGLAVTHEGVEERFTNDKDRVCLLDPAAKEELTPEHGDRFDVFLFGGILGLRSLPSSFKVRMAELTSNVRR